MESPTVSVITAVYNRQDTVGEAIRSVQSQTYRLVEHLIVDGLSTDGSLAVVRKHQRSGMMIISEPDEGIYDALNKGIGLASGDVIGLLHSDDVFAHSEVFERVIDLLVERDLDAVYGDMVLVPKYHSSRVVRHWHAGEFTSRKLRCGWMPPHPTLFLHRRVFEKFGVYDTSYRIAADYDAILRYFGSGELRVGYIPEVLVKMRLGGASNRSLKQIIRKSREDYRALRSNQIGGLAALLWKNLSKLGQFIEARKKR